MELLKLSTVHICFHICFVQRLKLELTVLLSIDILISNEFQICLERCLSSVCIYNNLLFYIILSFFYKYYLNLPFDISIISLVCPNSKDLQILQVEHLYRNHLEFQSQYDIGMISSRCLFCRHQIFYHTTRLILFVSLISTHTCYHHFHIYHHPVTRGLSL